MHTHTHTKNLGKNLFQKYLLWIYLRIYMCTRLQGKAYFQVMLQLFGISSIYQMSTRDYNTEHVLFLTSTHNPGPWTLSEDIQHEGLELEGEREEKANPGSEAWSGKAASPLALSQQSLYTGGTEARLQKSTGGEEEEMRQWKGRLRGTCVVCVALTWQFGTCPEEPMQERRALSLCCPVTRVAISVKTN